MRYPRHGESGSRNLFRTEGFYQLDMVLSKKFQMPWSENHRLTFRAEAYNLTNSLMWGNPNMTVGNALFGRSTTQMTGNRGREMQYTLRIHF